MHCNDEEHPKLTKLSTSRSMPELDRLPWLTDSFSKGRSEDVDSTTEQPAASPEARATSPITLGPPLALPYGPFMPDFSPQPSLIYKDVADPLADQGKSGFHNLGNTCFMNAGLQCLLSNPQMSTYFLQQQEVNPTDTSLLAQYIQVLHKVWEGKYSILNLSDFKRTLALYHPQFQDYRQHDCQEFLALVLDSLHEELNSCHSIYKPRPQTPPSAESGDGKSITRQEIRNQLSSMDEDYDGDENVTSSGGFEKENTGKNAEIITGNADSVDNNKVNEVEAQVTLDQTKPLGEQEDSPSQSEEEKSGKENQYEGEEGQGDKEILLNNVQRKFPTLEDLYMKDTKVLNVNMLATDLEEEEVALGSDKYHKPDNRNPRSEEDLEDTAGIFMEDMAGAMDADDLLEFEGGEKGSSPLKPLKETNLLANHKEKFSDDPYGKKVLFSEYCQGEDDTDCSINKIKRIKIDGDVEKKEKNVEMETKLKNNVVNWEECKQEVKVDVVCAGASSSSSSQDGATSGWKGDLENNRNLVNDQRLKQLSPQSNQKSLSRSQAELQALSPQPQLSFNNEAYMWSRYNLEADREWRCYLEKNKSVIVDAFQGQFKSTVVCSECHHVSVTFEPFMYLSVPLPHAMERQISVIFIPCDNKQPIRFLLTLHKNDKLGKLVEVLRGLIKEESCDLVLAEVFDNHIARTLDDQMQLKYVNDENRTVYAFEMLPAPADSDQKVPEIVDKLDTEQMAVLPNNAVPSPVKLPSASSTLISGTEGPTIKTGQNSASSTITSISQSQENRVDQEKIQETSRNTEGSNLVSNSSLTIDQEVLNNSVQSTGILSHGNLGLRNDVHWQTNLLNPESDWNIMETDQSHSTNENVADGGRGKSEESGNGLQSSAKASDNSGSERSEMPTTSKVSSSASTSATATAVSSSDGPVVHGDIDLCRDQSNDSNGEGMEFSKWRSCAICLEEMTDTELMIHAACGGTLCHNCLDMSFKHYGEAEFLCPVCSQAVQPADDFIQVNCMADYKPKTRILSVAVMQRHEDVDSEGRTELSMFGHPNMLYLPSELGGEMLYTHVDRVLPILANYTIVLTDGQGLRCSRCLYTEHCSGCLVARDSPVTLQPGDHLTVCFSGLDIVQRVNVSTYEDHKSVEEMRSKHPLTLSDCFTAFTQSERLDEHNPWFCPRCCKNQCANKTLTVWRFPQTLVVYLKRFVFHQLMSTKIENKVVFPLDDLDLYHFISGPKNRNLTYSLQSCVCHFGGVNSGHYTAYAKHPLRDEWCYFNDEQLSKKQPGEEEYSSAYVLFYQRKDDNVSMKLSQVQAEYSRKQGFPADVEMTDSCQSTSDPWLQPGSSAPLSDLKSQPTVLNNAKKDNTGQIPDSTSNGYDFYS